MADVDHLLERRAKLLASKLTARKDLLRQTLAPPGQRPPFTQQLSRPEALAFHRQHRYDPAYADYYKRLGPEGILELDNALAQANEQGMLGLRGGLQDGSTY